MDESTTLANPFVSVVIVSWNRKSEVEHTLSEYRKQTYKNFEIVVVDNNSTDGTKELIKAGFPEVRLIELSENTGFNAYNIGMKNARGEIIVVSDDDAYLEYDGIKKIVDKFNSNPNLCIAACKIIRFPSTPEFPMDPKEMADTTKSYDIHCFYNAGAGMRKNMIEKIGYYDEDFFIWCSEMSLSTRAIGAGYDVKYFPDITVYHKYYAHIYYAHEKSKLNIALYYTWINAVFYHWKYFPFHIAFGRTILKLPFDFFRTLLVSRSIVLPFKTLKAIITGFNKNLKKRKVIPKQYVKKALGYKSEISNIYSFTKVLIKRKILRLNKKM